MFKLSGGYQGTKHQNTCTSAVLVIGWKGSRAKKHTDTKSMSKWMHFCYWHERGGLGCWGEFGGVGRLQGRVGRQLNMRGHWTQKMCMWAHFTCLAAGAAREVHEKAPMEAHFCVRLQGRGGGALEHKIVPTVGTFSCSGAGEATRGYPNMKMRLWGMFLCWAPREGWGSTWTWKLCPWAQFSCWMGIPSSRTQKTPPLPSDYQNCTYTCVLVFGASVTPTKLEHENTQGVFVLSSYPSTSPPYTPTLPTP